MQISTNYLFVDGDILHDDGERLFIFGTNSMNAIFHASPTKRVTATRDYWTLRVKWWVNVKLTWQNSQIVAWLSENLRIRLSQPYYSPQPQPRPQIVAAYSLQYETQRVGYREESHIS